MCQFFTSQTCLNEELSYFCKHGPIDNRYTQWQYPCIQTTVRGLLSYTLRLCPAIYCRPRALQGHRPGSAIVLLGTPQRLRRHPSPERLPLHRRTQPLRQHAQARRLHRRQFRPNKPHGHVRTRRRNHPPGDLPPRAPGRGRTSGTDGPHHTPQPHGQAQPGNRADAGHLGRHGALT